MREAAEETLAIEQVQVRREDWTLAKPFIIARERSDVASLVVVELRDGAHCGRGESCPVEHYGETVEGVLAAARTMAEALQRGAPWEVLYGTLPAGAARNAVDCAVWDLRAKREGRRAWSLLGLAAPVAVESVFTISLNDPATMAADARAAAGYNILKLKLGGEGDDARVRAVRAAVPDVRLVADANESWSPSLLTAYLPVLAAARVEMLEQPLPAGEDGALADVDRLLPIGADESCHVAADIAGLAGRYDFVNIKLDKTGGLIEALRLLTAARGAGLETMVGCMLGTSLAMAPAMLIAPACRFVDLDGPLLIGRDREAGLNYRHGRIEPPSPALWG